MLQTLVNFLWKMLQTYSSCRKFLTFLKKHHCHRTKQVFNIQRRPKFPLLRRKTFWKYLFLEIFLTGCVWLFFVVVDLEGSAVFRAVIGSLPCFVNGWGARAAAPLSGPSEQGETCQVTKGDCWLHSGYDNSGSGAEPPIALLRGTIKKMYILFRGQKFVCLRRNFYLFIVFCIFDREFFFLSTEFHLITVVYTNCNR